VAAGTAAADMPSTVAVTTYDTTAAGFAQMVAVGGVMQDKLGVNLRPIPGSNDISRQAPLKQGVAQFSSTGFGVFYSQEGLFQFADREQWGPQDVRLVMINVSDGGIGFAIDPALGIDHPSDLAGVRVARIVGSPALNLLVEAYLTFGGLTWDDVEVVDFPGFGAWLDGYVAGQVDAGIAVTDSGTSGKLAASSRGVTYVTFPPEDTEGWQRLENFAPWFVPKRVTSGNEVPEEGLDFAVYHYPMLVSTADVDADTVYGFTKAMVEFFPEYRDAAPGAYGWALDRQDFSYVMPYHEGAIRYFKEIGEWTEADTANNEALLRRQAVLRDAWREVMARDIADDDAFLAAWQRARFEALSQAGFNPYFETW
jgi:TRAP transporter TAXI family solute receptor